jgi:hypothetical protein
MKFILDRTSNIDKGVKTELHNIRGRVTLTAEYPDNIELIDAFAIAMQNHDPQSIINALEKLADA